MKSTPSTISYYPPSYKYLNLALLLITLLVSQHVQQIQGQCFDQSEEDDYRKSICTHGIKYQQQQLNCTLIRDVQLLNCTTVEERPPILYFPRLLVKVPPSFYIHYVPHSEHFRNWIAPYPSLTNAANITNKTEFIEKELAERRVQRPKKFLVIDIDADLLNKEDDIECDFKETRAETAKSALVPAHQKSSWAESIYRNLTKAQCDPNQLEDSIFNGFHCAERNPEDGKNKVRDPMDEKKKIMVAHEDYFRPQCKMFFDDYKFEMEKGHYDPDLVEYWLERAHHYYTKIGTTISAIYAYEIFECPVNPYRLDPYEPDLRIIDTSVQTNISDTELGLPFEGNYILIEIHGQTGYTYTKTVRDAGCVRPPHNLTYLTTKWKEYLKTISNPLACPDLAIKHPKNIWEWNLNNTESKYYVNCTERGNFTGELSNEILDAPYEIMRRGSGNSLIFNSANHKLVYVFLAIELDPPILKEMALNISKAQNVSLDKFNVINEQECWCPKPPCRHKRIFGLYVNAHKESADLISFLRFMGFFTLSALGILLLFFIFRVKVRREFRERALVQRLERAAWQLLARYEKILLDLRSGRNTTTTIAAEGETAEDEQDEGNDTQSVGSTRSTIKIRSGRGPKVKTWNKHRQSLAGMDVRRAQSKMSVISVSGVVGKDKEQSKTSLAAQNLKKQK